MKPSDTFEGPNSSLAKTFREATKESKVPFNPPFNSLEVDPEILENIKRFVEETNENL